MRLLAIEATGAAVSVALIRSDPDDAVGDRVARFAAIEGPGTSDRLIQLIDDLLAAEHGGLGSIETIAVDRGPGGFTAVRAAVAAARGLALALGRPILPLSAFEAVAAAAAGSGVATVLAAIDTGRGSVLVQAFTGDVLPLGPAADRGADPALSSLPRPVVVAGSGRVAVLAAVAADDDVRGIDVVPDARTLGLLAARRLRTGLAPAPPFTVEPVYLRPPDARPPRRLIERPDAASSDHAGPQA